MIFSAMDIESLVVGKELLLVLIGLIVVFVSCFVMGYPHDGCITPPWEGHGGGP